MSLTNLIFWKMTRWSAVPTWLVDFLLVDQLWENGRALLRLPYLPIKEFAIAISNSTKLRLPFNCWWIMTACKSHIHQIKKKLKIKFEFWPTIKSICSSFLLRKINMSHILIIQPSCIGTFTKSTRTVEKFIK